jgi:Zn-dependent protease with chaperone function
MRWVLVAIALAALPPCPARAAAARVDAAAAGAVGDTAPDELTPVDVPQPSAAALRYYTTGNWLWVANEFWGVTTLALVLCTGLSGRLQRVAQRLGRSWFFTLVLYLVMYQALIFVINLPLSYYAGFVREHAFGRSNQTLARWFTRSLTRLAVTTTTVTLVAWVPFLLMRKSPRRWWLYTTLLSVPLVFFSVMVAPVVIDPLFNRYQPLKDPVLERRILDEAKRAGIDGSRIFEVDKSADSKVLNAYVTGVFGTKRIVLYDTLLARLNEREILAVLGHEMGHYALGHVSRSILLSTFLILAGTLWIDCAGRWLIARNARRFGFDRLSEIAALPLILLLANLGALVAAPAVCAYSRHQEREADRFSLELTQTNRSAAAAFIKLQETNLSNPRPGPLFRFFRSTHPSIGERIDFCNSYRPWTRGEPLVYGAHFRY